MHLNPLKSLARSKWWRRAALAPALLAVACATTEPSAGRQKVVTPAPMPEADAKFYAFVRDFRATALAQGIRPETYDRSMAGIARNARVEELNLSQPEFVKPVWDYLDGAVSPRRISDGQQMLATYPSMLLNVESRFGVPKEILVAIWGIESNYGEAMGSFNMFEALATLAYDGPRAEYARRELLAALKIEEQEHLDPRAMTSSWAGAFGQTQFVPTSFLDHAVDGDGDGKRDLWHSPADALASAATLLSNAQWQKGQPCEYEVTLPKNFHYEDADSDNYKPLDYWRSAGVKTVAGAALPAGDVGAIYLPAGARGPAFMLLSNFKVVLKYNNAATYALAVCMLADRMKGGAPVMAAWPRDEQPLTRDERMAFQHDLKTLGYDPGDIDGVLGHKVRAALRAYQLARGLAADGFPTQDMLMRMEREIAAKGN